ncbi:MAG: aminotransferase class V-fold PLP-dependent enzyme, partial [Arthrobacter sp.]
MRIGLVAPPWIPVPPPSYGGTESVVHTLATGLMEAGHDVVLAASSDSTCPVPRVSRLEPSTATTMDSGRQEILHVLRAYDAMADVDVVHDHTILGPLALRLPPNVPRATTLHGPFDEELTRIYGAMRPETALVAISEHQASTARNIKIDAVIHHGIDVRDVRYSPAHRGGAWFLVDAAQTAGVLPINVAQMGIDLLAFTGHKGLQGPPGCGGLVIADDVDVSLLEPLVRGGTGSHSEYEEQPDDL